VNADVHIDAGSLAQAVSALITEFSKPDQLLKAAGHAVAAHVFERISYGKTDPAGAAWAPWAAYTLEQRSKKGNVGQGLLWDTGALRASIKSEVSGNELAIGSDLGYARELQFGEGNMPARAFLGWDFESEKLATNAIEDHLRAVFPWST
jgi:phage virion morphogenesis protein